MIMQSNILVKNNIIHITPLDCNWHSTLIHSVQTGRNTYRSGKLTSNYAWPNYTLGYSSPVFLVVEKGSLSIQRDCTRDHCCHVCLSLFVCLSACLKAILDSEGTVIG